MIKLTYTEYNHRLKTHNLFYGKQSIITQKHLMPSFFCERNTSAGRSCVSQQY